MNKVFYKASGLKKVSSLLLIFLFTFGITPKKTLHDCFANHKDSASTIPVDRNLQITKAGFNCDCDNLVAESHFITFCSPVTINIPSVNSFVSYRIPSFVTPSFFQNNLRGPPAQFLTA